MSLDRTHEEVQPFTKASWGVCEGRTDVCTLARCADGEPLCGTLGRPAKDGKRRVKGCGDPVASGKRSRTKGDAKARKMRKALGLAGANTRHEELWGGSVISEMKSGLKAKTVQTAYENSRAQSDAAKAVGDPRPFIAGFAPDGTSRCYYVLRDGDLEQGVLALAVMWGFIGEKS